MNIDGLVKPHALFCDRCREECYVYVVSCVPDDCVRVPLLSIPFTADMFSNVNSQMVGCAGYSIFIEIVDIL